MSKNSFRISAKRIFLTYPKFDGTKESIKEQLFNILAKYLPFDYCISQESHEDGSPHFHIYLIAKTKFNISKANERLKLIDNNKVAKSGDYQTAWANTSTILRYLTKEDKAPLTNIKFDPNTGLLLDIEEQTIQVYKEEGFQPALHYFRHNASNKELVKKTKSIVSTLRTLNNIDQHKKPKEFLPLDLVKFKNSSVGQQILHWFYKESDKTLFFHGDSGIGKTAVLKTLLTYLLHNQDTWDMVRHFEELKYLDLKKVNTILFDDPELSKEFKNNGEAFIWFTDTRDNSPKRLLYGIVNLHGIIRIITSNKSLTETFEDANIFNLKQRAGIKRRAYEIDGGNEVLPFIKPTKENIEEILSNKNIWHPNKVELKLTLKIAAETKLNARSLTNFLEDKKSESEKASGIQYNSDSNQLDESPQQGIPQASRLQELEFPQTNIA